MKVAHISFMPNPINGVEYKIIQMAQSAKDYDFDFYILNNYINKKEENLIYKQFETLNLPISLKLQQKLFTHLLLLKNVNFDDYDYIVIRYVGGCSIGSSYIYKQYGYKIFSEHHTNEDIEYKEYRKGIINWIKFGLEKYCAKKNLKYVQGIIAVTQEIVDIELKKSGKKSSLSLPNGINTDVIPFTPAKIYDSKLIKMLFIASNEASWHGLDKLVTAIRSYKGNVKIQLNIVGGFDTKKYQDIDIVNHGFLKGEKLDKLFMSIHIGVSSLGLERLGLKSASVLKSREYMSRGIPFIYSYNDDDFLDNNLALQLFDIEIEKIIKYLKTLDNSHLNKMRDFALTNLDWKHKIKILWHYLEKHIYNFQNIVLEFACHIFSNEGIGKGAHILELGFGEGDDLVELHNNGFITYGVEVLDFKYQKTQDKLRNLGIDVTHLQLLDLKKFKLINKDSSIDAVFSNQFFVHIEDMTTVAKELNRIMKINGIIYSEYVATYPLVDSHTRLPPFHLLKNKKIIFNLFLIMKKIKKWDKKKFSKVYLYYKRYLHYRNYQKTDDIFKNNGFEVLDITYERRKIRLKKDGVGTIKEFFNYKLFRKKGNSKSIGLLLSIYLRVYAWFYKYTKNRVILIRKIA